MVKTTRYVALHTKCSSMDGMDGPGPRDVLMVKTTRYMALHTKCSSSNHFFVVTLYYEFVPVCLSPKAAMFFNTVKL